MKTLTWYDELILCVVCTALAIGLFLGFIALAHLIVEVSK